ncbi:MAG: sugar transferase, partial [Candidatus Edwardsbacteria bacterium]|nr:sugar transferase [Candidatus Edwardsbacteria bacterium]
RLFDIIISSIALVALSPVILLTALAIVLDSRGGALFLQKRAGRDGAGFDIYKFRTMVAGAERKGPLLAARGDPRVTRIGRFLRRWSLDELPQLLNILKGDMSVVGPRPELPPIVAAYTPFQRQALAVRPGLTGLPQVMGRDDLSMETKIRLDVYYIRRQTFCFDLWIIVRTATEVLTGRGAF